MYAVVYVPQFSLQAALRHEPELWKVPVALVDPASRIPVVCEATAPARAAGVSDGCTAPQAMARCGSVLIRTRSARQESAATHAILQCAYAFSPHLEATAPGVCTLDLRGLAAVSGKDRAGLEEWARKLQAALAGVQLAASVGLGPTPNTAQHAARWGKGIELVEDPAPFIAGLPVAALEPSPDVAVLLERWGVRTTGELLALGQEALTARLGLEAWALFAAASCTTARPLHLVHPTERFEESFEFEPEVETLEPLLFLLRRFVDQLSQRLQPRGFAAETLVLTLRLAAGDKLAVRLRLPEPTREPEVLFRTLHTYLETVRTESPVKAVDLTVLPTQDEQKQLGLFETVLADRRQFQETLARLAAVLGPNRVGTPAMENTHRPDAFQLQPPDFENAPVPAEARRPSPVHTTPIRRFRPAIQAEVECETVQESSALPDPAALTPTAASPARMSRSRPVSIRCSVARGRLKITVGPWRASGNWWDPAAWEREEWDASTSDGTMFRLVRQPEGWFVEGVID